MKKKYLHIKRFISTILAIAFMLQVLYIPVLAETDVTYEGNTLNDWTVGTFWDKTDEPNTLSWTLSNNQTNNAKLTVDYYAPLSAMTQSYPAGTVEFSIPDIGIVKREGVPFKPITSANSADSDWTCRYDNDNMAYIFTNAVTFPANEPIAGGFTMLWQINGRACVKEFNMVKNPIFSLRDSDGNWKRTKMSPLTFSCTTERDFYSVNLQSSVLGYDDLTRFYKSNKEGYDSDPDIPDMKDYTTYQYNTSFNLHQMARASDRSSYFVKVSITNDEQGLAPASITDEQMSKIYIMEDMENTDFKPVSLSKIYDPYTEETVWGFYRFGEDGEEEKGELKSDQFFLAFPEELLSKYVKVESFLSVHYLDEDEGVYYNYLSSDLMQGEKLTDSDIRIISKYSYKFGDGNFSSSKVNPYEIYYDVSRTHEGSRPGSTSSQLLSKQIYNKGKVTFTIGGQYRMTTTSSSASAKKITKKTTSSSASGDIAGGEGSEYDLDTQYDMILADDRLSVLLENGRFRLLESNEYKITKLIGPTDIYGYDYDIFISKVGYRSSDVTPAAVARMGDHVNNSSSKHPDDSDYYYYGSGNTSTSNVISFNNISARQGFEGFTDGVKAVYIKIKGFSGNYSADYKLEVEFNCNYDTGINSVGKITNIGYMRAFKTGTKNDVFSIDNSNYDNSYFNNQIIKPLDRASNDKLVYHTMSSVYLRDMQTVITSATKVDSTKRSRAEGDGYKIDITSSGTLKADDSYDGVPTELDKFALYVEIPKLLTIDQRLTNISISDCSGTDILGEAVDHSAFEQNVSYRLITYSDGTRVIAAEFDFSAAPLDISKLTSLNLNIPAEIQYNDFRTSSTKSFTVKSYTKLNGNGVGKVIAKNGSTTDTRDFDGNNITDEVMASSSAGKSYTTVAEDWRDTVEKFVKSYRDETWNYQADSTTSKWVSETTVNAYSDELDENANLRATYQYRVSFDMGLPTKDIIFSDVLENANETQWHGKLKSLDFSYALSIGLKPTVYYSDDETKEYSETPVDNSNIAEYISNLDGFTCGGEVTGNIWTAPDENIRSFVVKFDTSSVPGEYVRSRQVYFYINMQAPDDKNITRDENTIYGKYAVNEHKVFYTSQTSVNYQRIELKASIAKVKLLPPVSLLTMLKVDGEDNKPLIGAEYTFYTDENATINVRDWEGNITAANIPSDKFGEIIVDTLEPGTYYYKETKAPIGYRIDDTIYTITLGGEGNKADKVYNITTGDYVNKNTKLTGKIIFTKLDANDSSVTGISGAVYSLYNTDGSVIYTDEYNKYAESGGTKSEFKTDSDGKITITGLPWGNYYLLETQAPAGYEINSTKVWVNISKTASTSESQRLNKAILIETNQADTEKTASVRLIKYDRDGATPLANAWFELQKKNGEKWEKVSGYEYLKTGKNGYVTVTDLKFGTYRFKEINPPVGYEMPSEKEALSDEITLTASTVGTVQSTTKTNERIPGKVTLRKTSDDGIPVKGARFELYMVNGVRDDKAPAGDPADSLIQTGLVTKTVDGQDGVISVTGLDWGTYYFKEISSPSGYNPAAIYQEFTVSAETAAVGCDINNVINERRKGEVVLNKTVGEAFNNGSKDYSVDDSVPDAKFSLYTAEGEKLYVKYNQTTGKYTVCEAETLGKRDIMTTNAEGKIDVEGISWGAYYFEEVQAPAGFALADKIRFTVNSVSCLSVQELECQDFPMKCLITIDKKINDKLAVFGTPAFTFKVEALDNQDNVKNDYTMMITLNGDSLSGSATVQVPAGKYRVKEIPVNRYKLTKTRYVTEDDKTTVPDNERYIDGDRVDEKPQYEETDPGKAFIFTLSGEKNESQKVEVEFTNTLENYSGVSHTDSLTNIIPSKRKITGFSISYADDIIDCDKSNDHCNFTLERSKLSGVITYDDGTEEAMTAEQFEGVRNASNNSENFVLDIGYSKQLQVESFTAAYTDPDTSKTYKANFYVTVGPYQVTETQRVIYRTDSSNSCVFPNGKKRYSVNTVYYNDNAAGTAKTAVSGKYIVPEMIDQQRYLTNWVIVSGIEDDIGTKLAPTEQAITEYLAKHYADDAGGLRELEVRAVVGDPIYNFEYKGEVEVFTAPKDGIYYLEGWGAQGGDSVTGRDTNFPTEVTTTNFNELIKETEGGRGGYSYGYVYLHEGDEVYIAVGGKGNTRSYNKLLTGDTEIGTNDGGYNGGGSTYNIDHSGFWYNGSGGGATHFAINSNRGTLSAYKDNTDDILLVAGGGGGSAYYLNQQSGGGKHTGMGGYGGGEIGGSNHDNTSPTSSPEVKTATGGTQTTGGTGVGLNNDTPVNGSFGQGGNGDTHSWGSGGGGGWYGGGSSALQGGGGGSGHVNESALITGATMGGNETFFEPGGTQETGPTGAGYARITLVSDNKFNLQYSQTVNQFTAPFSGYYKLEGWGAAGGAAGTDDDNYKYTGNYHSVATEYYGAEGGRGGYSEGYIYLKAGDKIYYAVGGMGKTQIRYDKTEVVKYDHSGGFNGGGDSTLYDPGNESTYSYNAGGGGATHFALTKTSDGLLKNYSSSQSDVLLVAGGGGGSAFIEYADQTWYHYGHGGAGGGLEGGSVYNNASFNNSTIKVTGGTQTTYGKEYINETQKANGNGAFGQGGSNGEQCQEFTGRASGGGGGWYGGGSSGFQGGGGGSSYLGTNASIDVINASTIAGNTVDYTTTDGKVMSPEHMPTFKGAITDNGVYGITSTAETMIGNRGNGYARITYIPYTESIDYTCVEKVQSFTAPVEGIYKLEAWGASGGDAKQTQDANIGILKGGRGGYSYGNVYLTAGQTIYLAVGGEGESIAFRVNGVAQTTYSTLQRGRGYNGGGDAYLYSTDTYKYAGGGGGATHFALTKQGKGVLSDYEAVKDTDVLLVAGGGGGALYCSGSSWLYAAYGGYGGGVNGGSGKVTDSKDENIKNKEIPGGTQEQQTNHGNYTFGTFGQGTNATSNSIADGGGGGGWYGGAKGNDVNKSMSGGGGSGHCNGDELMSDYGYATIGGNESFIAPDGESETGHAGDGYARVTFVEFPKVYDYDYTGSVRTFTAPVKGKYKLEAWGAQGGGSIDTMIHSPIPNVSVLINNEEYHTVEGGRGGYSTGVVNLDAGDTVYIVVGGEGSKFEQLVHNVLNAVTVNGGYNGGGDTHFAQNSHRMSIGSGGGATHFALSDGVLSSLSNNRESVLLVAGGGGGSAFSLSYGSSGEWINQGAGGYGGGETGGNSIKGENLGTNDDRTVATGGTQSGGGAGGSGIANAAGGFGKGGTANDYGTGGGGGWYGGGASRIQGGAGGSGYVKSSLSSGETIAGDGNTVFLAPNGSTETGHAGNGYARITRIG